MPKNKKGQKTYYKFFITSSPMLNAKSKGPHGFVWTTQNVRKWEKYIMCITDAFSKYVELVAIPDKSATTVASALFSRWLCRHGLPLEIVSDGGK